MPTDINSNKILGVPGSTSITHVSTVVPIQQFISVWKTTNRGDIVELPYITTGNYNGTIDWGDGTPIVANTYANRTHAYALNSIYTIIIEGQYCDGWNFRDTPASSYMMKGVVQWGQLRLTGSGSNDTGGYFKGCANLYLSAVSDLLDLTGTTNMGGMFDGCLALPSINNINSWNTSLVNNMGEMFMGCINFDQPLTFNTLSVVNMNYMFSGATLFNQDIGGWNISSLQTAYGFMDTKTPATFSTANLDAIYNGWSTTVTQIGVTISFNTAKYTPAGAFGKGILSGPYGWFITDGGI